MSGSFGSRLAVWALSLSLGVWVGAVIVIFLSTAVLFANKDAVSSQSAGDLAGQILRGFDIVKLVLVPVILASTVAVSALLPQSHRIHTLRWVAVLLLLGLALMQALVLHPLVAKLRVDLTVADPAELEAVKARFNKVHGLSMLMMMLDIVWAVGATALTILAPSKTVEPAEANGVKPE